MQKLNEQLAVVATIDPSTSTTTTTTDVIDMSRYDRVLFIVSIGTVAGTTDFLVQSGTATGTVTTSVVSMVQWSATADNQQALIEVDASALGERHRYITGQIKTGGANLFSVVALGARARYKPASDDDLASVTQIVDA
jgi:hypothetical protein